MFPQFLAFRAPSDGQLQQLRWRRWVRLRLADMPRDSSGAVDNAKLERWLWCVALYPSVKDAKKAARAGAVQVNGKTVKPAKKLRRDDAVTLSDGRTISVLGIPRADADRCRTDEEARQYYCEESSSAGRDASTTPKKKRKKKKKKKKNNNNNDNNYVTLTMDALGDMITPL